MTQFLRRAVLLASCAMAGFAATAAHAAEPKFQMPFPCGQTWRANTWTGHNPTYAVDMTNAAGATDGATIVAAYGGTVKTSTYSTTTGYGNYIVIDHGGGWTTLYAHLKSRAVSAGASVKMGQKIGAVGNTSAKYDLAPHLHFEERLNGTVKKVKWNGVELKYVEKKNYVSKNACSGSGGASGTVKTSGANLNVRSGAGTNFSIVGSLANGAAVSIRCQKAGESVSGTYGTSNIWNNIGAAGTNKFIPDAYTYTGSDGRVAPNC